jgi:Tol biopolymer transport system component
MRIFLVLLLALGYYDLHAQQAISFDKPPVAMEVFAPGVVSTGFSERDFALSPDGTEMFYTLQSEGGVFQTILHRTKDKNGKWSNAEVADFAGVYSDLEPAFSADGKQLFFSSNRPLQGNEVKDFDIYVAEKINGKWANAKNIGKPVNTTADEFYPSITRSGNLYYTAAYANGIGKEDIWMAQKNANGYTEPTVLDTTVNGRTYEFNAFVSPDEDFILFTSYGRKDDKGKGDLYISLKDAGGKWQPAKHLSILNSDKLDYCPFISADKKIMFFTSERSSVSRSYPKPVTMSELNKAFTSPGNGKADIYWISFDKVLESVK